MAETNGHFASGCSKMRCVIIGIISEAGCQQRHAGWSRSTRSVVEGESKAEWDIASLIIRDRKSPRMPQETPAPVLLMSRVFR